MRGAHSSWTWTPTGKPHRQALSRQSIWWVIIVRLTSNRPLGLLLGSMSKLLIHLRLMAMAGPRPVRAPQIEADKQEYVACHSFITLIPTLTSFPPSLSPGFMRVFRYWRCLLEFLGLKVAVLNPPHSTNLPHFTQAADGITVDVDGLKVTHKQPAGHQAIIAEPGLTNTTIWRATIHSLCHNNWVMLGVNSRPDASDGFSATTTYGWGGMIQVYEPTLQTVSDWAGFRFGD